MKRRLLTTAGAAMLLLLAAGLIAPYLGADRYGKSIQRSLEAALGRRVEIGEVRFSVFKGPGFSVAKVVIHDDPSIGIEPVARVETLEVVPRFWSLLRGRLVASSIRLEDATINLSKSGAPAEPGRWNFEPLLNRNVLSTFPGIQVRNGRINFKFGDTRPVFYLLNADVDISPPGSDRAWSIQGSAEPARTDRPARGLGAFQVKGKWWGTGATDKLELDLRLEPTGLAEVAALLRGSGAGVHGTLSGRLHLSGPLRDVGITGRLRVEDVHRWDLLPPKGADWPLDVRGRLNLLAQLLELESSSAGNVQLPLLLRFRVENYLAQPRWGLSVNWNRFGVEPLVELARHMGAEVPAKFRLAGTVDGALVYSGDSWQGEMKLHDAAFTIPGAPPLTMFEAAVQFQDGHVRLSPSPAKLAKDELEVEADYTPGSGALQLQISSEGMDVAALRSQAALAPVAWLEQVRSGRWSGQLRYRHAPPAEPAWSGRISLANGVIPIDGLADPLQVETAAALIDGARLVVDHLVAHAGRTDVSGDYRYDPQASRPHRVRLFVKEADAAEVEREFAPSLRRSNSLIARAFGTAAIPDWMRSRNLEGSLQIGSLLLTGQRLENLRATLQWEVARVEFNLLQARLGRGALTGTLAVNLRGARPAYAFTGKLRGGAWLNGLVDAVGSVDTFGTGPQLWTNLASLGTFNATGVEAGADAPWKSASGKFEVAWAGGVPRIRLTNLQLASGDETYTGSGATQDDGRLLILLTSGAREMRLSGATIARLKVDESPHPTESAPQ